ncbi:hypothetical protein DXF96_02520 [Heyndrickxia coagulans]|jgi:hypothetical protein|uniref:Uncharacterized protein n=1 Tax=Heyndrickxia coagulans 36D1 TaxID=345219 RepID=G2TLK8_HEYCO|nr:hypothetical protein Bcoa_1905 [Heyndrickxia coagulans 36D1]AWP38185.1 hypothetical protein CYJ15_15025 [Heyndrickxia coagulans]QDI60497.1 hypothetical protein DXF96_02520 [Heyndrickxia coagulans]
MHVRDSRKMRRNFKINFFYDTSQSINFLLQEDPNILGAFYFQSSCKLKKISNAHYFTLINE